MQGYAILAEALAKQNIQHCYGIVGTHPLIKESQSSNSASPFKVLESNTTDAGINSKLAIQQATLATSQEYQEYAFVFQGQATPTPSAESPTPGPTAGQ